MPPFAPKPAAPRPRRTLSRRAALRLLGGSAAGAFVAALAGCRSAQTGGGRSSGVPTVSGADDLPPTARAAELALAGRVADEETALLAAYDAAFAAHPELEPTLAPLRADHVRHRDALRPDAASLIPSPRSSAAATPRAAGTALGASSTPASGAPAAATVTQLANLERAAAASRVAELMAAPADLARLLASIGGCEASHESMLRATR